MNTKEKILFKKNYWPNLALIT